MYTNFGIGTGFAGIVANAEHLGLKKKLQGSRLISKTRIVVRQ
jgi:hypothetical protein